MTLTLSPTAVRHLCCGEQSPVFPSNYCPFCGKSVHEYGVEIDNDVFGSFFTEKLEEAGVKVNRINPWFASRLGEEPLAPVLQSESEAISAAIRSIGLALHATNGAIATDLPDMQPDETCWRIDHSEEIKALQYLEELFNNTDTDS